MGFFQDLAKGDLGKALGTDLTGGNSLVSKVGKNPIAQAALAVVAPETIPYMAGARAASDIVQGKPITPGTLLNLATTASGFGDIGIDPSTLSTAKNALAGVNALKTGNVMGMISSLAQMTGSSSDVKSALSAINAVTSAQKGDIAGLINALNNITGSIDPMVANLASKIIKTVEPTSVNVNTSPTSENVYTSTDPLSVPSGQTVTQNGVQINPLALPGMPTVKAPPATIGKIKELDLQKLFDQVNSLNPVEDNTIQAKRGGSIDDLMQLLNRG